jgi:SAM-dependent methyltransferase
LIEIDGLLDYYNEDYVQLSDVMTPPERTRAEVAFILRTLEIGIGAKILDLGCGYGRIAHELARAGAEVTGVDLAPAMIDRARQRAQQDGLAIDYRVGDMARLPPLSGFDVVLIWFYSFGYGDERGHIKTLKSAYSALKKGGFLMFDQYNTHVLAAENHATIVEHGETLIVHKPLPEIEAGRWGVERIVVKQGNVHRAQFSCRCYTPPELRAMTIAAGFREVRFLGEDATPYRPDSRKLLTIAMK